MTATTIEQSKKLVELGIDTSTADMFWLVTSKPHLHILDNEPLSNYDRWEHYPAWSLSALLDYLSANFHVDIKYLDNYWELDCRVQVNYNKELVDACYEMIIKLHELKML